MDESDAFSYMFLKGWYEKQRRRNMKFAQLNGVQISEDQIKDLQKQIDGQRHMPKVVGLGYRLCSQGASWRAESADDGYMHLFSHDGKVYIMDRQSCFDLAAFMHDCIEDIDNGVCG